MSRSEDRFSGVLCILMFLIVVFPQTLFAEIIKWKDDKGKTHFTDNILKVPPQYRTGMDRSTPAYNKPKASPIPPKASKEKTNFRTSSRAQNKKFSGIDRGSRQVSSNVLTVEEAYKAIPHGRTPFNQRESEVAELDSGYLDDLFSLTDNAVVARVQQQQTMSRYEGGDNGQGWYDETIDGVLARLNALSSPEYLEEPSELIVSAIEEQKQFFQEWAEASDEEKADIREQTARHPLVQSSHRKLIKAYKKLMSQFPEETKHNKKAFFDHLCALDFI